MRTGKKYPESELNFLQIIHGNILVDFNARTGHNHGTKFRMRPNCLLNLYEKVATIL
jgi:hypothetical protein